MTPIKTATLFALALFASLASSPRSSFGQAGDAKDKDGTVQDEVWREMDVPPSPILTPEEALQSFSIEPGFSLELVASEPLVNDPVAITWDEDGRMWVAEMWAYMPDADGNGEDLPVSRVVVLEDLNGDGIMDRSTVFLDQLVLPRAVAIVEGGVLIADPPNLYYCEDLDGDLKADRKRVVAEYASTGNVEHAENGLVRGIDNWLYNAKSDRRIKFENGSTFLEEPTLSRGQWGITFDDWGRLFYNNNSHYLFGDAVPYEFAGGNPGWEPKAGLPYDVVPDQSVFTVRVNPGVNRMYRKGWARPDNRMKHIDAASDPEIFRGDRYPKSIHRNAFVPDPAGQIVSRFKLHDKGLGIVGEKQLHEHPKWGPVEFIASTDERFRPVATATGPDGFLYVVDMYRGIIQHKTYLTTFLRKQIIERGLDQPVGLGRIYRVVHETDKADRDVPKLSSYSCPALAHLFSSTNGWTRDTAQRLLAQRQPNDEETLATLRQNLSSKNELTRIHSLWTLEALDKISPDVLLTALENASPWVRTHVWRLASEFLDGEDKDLTRAHESAVNAPNKRVRLQAFQSVPKAAAVSATLALSNEDLSDPYFIDAAISKLYGQEEAFFTAANSIKSKREAFSGIIEKLVYAMYKNGERKAGADYLSNLSEADWRHTVIANALQSADDEIGVSAILDEYELASIDRGKTLYKNICATCHQTNGQGIAGLAPPLANSEWVKGSKSRLALIVAHGLSGPITVNGEEWDSVMPPHLYHPDLQEDRLTDLLNYLRATWAPGKPLYESDELPALFEKYKSRNSTWTVQELPTE